MKILKNNIADKNIREITCDHCGSVLEVSKDETTIGYLGMSKVRCPVCGEETFTDVEEWDEDVTSDTFRFPDHFYYFGDGVKLSDKKIEEYVKSGINFFRKNPSNFCYITGSGNTSVIVLNFSGDEQYTVVVSKNYYELEIPYDNTDYEMQESINYEWENKGMDTRRKE